MTISDEKGNKMMFHGSIKGFAIRKTITGRKLPGVSITGLDWSWQGTKVLCILLEPGTGETV